MCIAIGKMAGRDMPSEKILRNCFKNNKDGGGFAFNYNNQVIIKKGFMTEDEFIKAIKFYDEKYCFKNRGVLIHTRITTHGGTSPSMCHPFPIVDDEGALKKTDYVSKYAVIHNGIISLTSSEAHKKGSMSDTAVFVEKYLTKIAQNKDWLNIKANIELIEDLIDSKMAILNTNGEIVMTKGFTEDNGVFYSNSSYQDNYYKAYSLSNWDGWDDYIDKKYGSSYKYLTNYTTKKHDKADKDKNTKLQTIELMKMDRTQEVYFTEGATLEFCEDTDYFITANHDIYCSDGKIETTYVAKRLYYIGEGVFIDTKSLKPIDFKKTNTILESQLC